MGALFSKKNKEVFSTPLGLNNPVTVQVLGICSALAVTAKLEPAIVMGLSVTVITAFSNVVISLLRKTIPNRIRIIVQLVVVAALVTIVSEILESFCLRCKRAAFRICRSDYHKLYPYGTSGSICHAERSVGVFPRRCGQRFGICQDSGYRGFLPRVAGFGYVARFQHPELRAFAEDRLCKQRLDADAAMALILCACIIWYQRARHKELQEK